LNANFLDIGEGGEGTGGVRVVCGSGILNICSTKAFVESRQNFGRLKGRHIEESTPDVRTVETTGREAGDDAEIIGTAFEGTP
jgi:hypothetical protein